VLDFELEHELVLVKNPMNSLMWPGGPDAGLQCMRLGIAALLAIALGVAAFLTLPRPHREIERIQLAQRLHLRR